MGGRIGSINLLFLKSDIPDDQSLRFHSPWSLIDCSINSKIPNCFDEWLYKFFCDWFHQMHFFLPYSNLLIAELIFLLWISQVKKYHLSLFELNDRVAFSEAKSVTCIISAKFFRLLFSAAREREKEAQIGILTCAHTVMIFLKNV